MPGLNGPKQDATLSPFSARVFAEKARAFGIELSKASWMAAQPISYGIEAGRRLDERWKP